MTRRSFRRGRALAALLGWHGAIVAGGGCELEPHPFAQPCSADAPCPTAYACDAREDVCVPEGADDAGAGALDAGASDAGAVGADAG